MNFSLHIIKQIKTFIKFPIQFLKILFDDIKKDFFYDHKKNIIKF